MAGWRSWLAWWMGGAGGPADSTQQFTSDPLVVNKNSYALTIDKTGNEIVIDKMSYAINCEMHGTTII